MDNAGRVHILQTSEDLVEEILDELLLQWTRGEESVQIGSEELSDEVAGGSADVPSAAMIMIAQTMRKSGYVHVFEGGDEDVAEGDDLYTP